MESCRKCKSTRHNIHNNRATIQLNYGCVQKKKFSKIGFYFSKKIALFRVKNGIYGKSYCLLNFQDRIPNKLLIICFQREV